MIGILAKLGHVLRGAERKHGIVLLALIVVGTVLEMICTGGILPAIAIMLQGDVTNRLPGLRSLLVALGNPTRTQLIAGVMGSLVAIYLVKNVFLAYLAWRQTRFAYGVQARLSQDLFTAYLRQPYTFHLQRNSAQLIRNVASEVTMVSEALVSGLNVGTELLVLIGISCLLLTVEPIGTLVAALVLGSSAWLFHRIVRARIAHWGETRLRHEVLRQQHLQQGLGGAKDVKLLGREDDFIDQYRVHNLKTARVGQYQAAIQMLPRLWLEMLAVVGLATLVLAMLAQGREMSAIFPTLGLFAAAAFRLMPSVNRILVGMHSLRFTQPVVEALSTELALAPSGTVERRSKQGTPDAEFASEIRLSNIAFTYPGAAAPAIEGVSIRIRKGESVGFVGASGSGKSTLVDVILGLLVPARGQVCVDGRDIREDLRGWQDQIGYVSQSIYLTDDTLRRNVAFGLPNGQIDDAAVRRAIRAAQLDDFVAGLPAGVETVVGERGIRLSGGQRQRIGIARALYHEPAVLVLDEATSSLDTETERGVMQAVSALHGIKTVLIVAHRLSTVADCDRLYRLEKGKLAEAVDQTRSARVTAR